MKTLVAALLAIASLGAPALAVEYHVSLGGNDANVGTAAAPFRTIQHAADTAQPGDVITVHNGVYRERITPPRSGDSDSNRIVYQSAPGEKVSITGSEVVTNWVNLGDGVWKATVPNSLFGSFNPYSDLIHGDWFNPLKRDHHTGAVYLDTDWLSEAAKLNDVLRGDVKAAVWFAQVGGENTTIWARFAGVDPTQHRVEINVRQTVFYPARTGINYLTVRGFTLEHAATPWAPPTAEQIGLIGTNWSKGWIIENNTVQYSICSGIALGKYGDQYDNTSANSAVGYVETIKRALADGWSKENIGHHIVRNNTVAHCEQAGIVGSLGAIFSVVTGNTIHDINVRQAFSGAEMAGIKFHGAIDVVISHNNIFRTSRGLWLDWMAQGTRVTANLFHDNKEDIFVEVDHGPFVIDNNILLSPRALWNGSQGGAYAHNLFAGVIELLPFGKRQTPFLKPHSTEVAGYHDNPNGDDRFFNNIFAYGADLSAYDNAPLPLKMDGNVYLKGSKPSKFDAQSVQALDFNPNVRLTEDADGITLVMKWNSAWNTAETRKLVTSDLLGRAAIPDLPYEQADGSPVRIDTNYSGHHRSEANPTPGPFAELTTAKIKVKVW